MLIPLAHVLEKRPHKIQTAVVVGADELQQKREFDLCGVRDVLWIEARPYAVGLAKDKYPRAEIAQACVCPNDKKRAAVKFWELHPSSVKYSGALEPLLALNNELCPHARVRGHRFYNAVTLDSLLAGRKVDLLQLDVCGLELAILKTLQNMPATAHVKVYRDPLWHNGATVAGVDALLDAIGYTCVLEAWDGVAGEKVYAF
jgi:hypothetical protein